MPRTPHWFTRTRERRRAKRQHRLERDYFERRRRATLTPESTPNAYQHTSGFAFWAGLGGDGGGGDGGGGGA